MAVILPYADRVHEVGHKCPAPRVAVPVRHEHTAVRLFKARKVKIKI